MWLILNPACLSTLLGFTWHMCDECYILGFSSSLVLYSWSWSCKNVWCGHADIRILSDEAQSMTNSITSSSTEHESIDYSFPSSNMSCPCHAVCLKFQLNPTVISFTPLSRGLFSPLQLTPFYPEPLTQLLPHFSSATYMPISSAWVHPSSHANFRQDLHHSRIRIFTYPTQATPSSALPTHKCLYWVTS